MAWFRRLFSTNSGDSNKDDKSGKHNNKKRGMGNLTAISDVSKKKSNFFGLSSQPPASAEKGRSYVINNAMYPAKMMKPSYELSDFRNQLLLIPRVMYIYVVYMFCFFDFVNCNVII